MSGAETFITNKKIDLTNERIDQKWANAAKA